MSVAPEAGIRPEAGVPRLPDGAAGPGGTGDPAVDAILAGLADMDAVDGRDSPDAQSAAGTAGGSAAGLSVLPVEEHVQLYAQLHDRLLAELDTDPG